MAEKVVVFRAIYDASQLRRGAAEQKKLWQESEAALKARNAAEIKAAKQRGATEQELSALRKRARTEEQQYKRDIDERTKSVERLRESVAKTRGLSTKIKTELDPKAMRDLEALELRMSMLDRKRIDPHISLDGAHELELEMYRIRKEFDELNRKSVKVKVDAEKGKTERVSDFKETVKVTIEATKQELTKFRNELKFAAKDIPVTLKVDRSKPITENVGGVPQPIGRADPREAQRIRAINAETKAVEARTRAEKQHQATLDAEANRARAATPEEESQIRRDRAAAARARALATARNAITARSRERIREEELSERRAIRNQRELAKTEKDRVDQAEKRTVAPKRQTLQLDVEAARERIENLYSDPRLTAKLRRNLEELDAKLAQQDRHLDIELDLKGYEKAERKVNTLITSLRGVQDSVEIGIRADDTNAQKKLEAIKANLEELRAKAEATVLDPKMSDKAKRSAELLLIDLDRLDRKVANPRVTLEDANLVEAKALRIDSSLKALERDRDIRIALKTEQALKDAVVLRGVIDQLSARAPNIKAKVNSAAAKRDIDKIVVRLEYLRAMTVSPNINMHGVLKAEAEIIALRKQLNSLDKNIGSGTKVKSFLTNLADGLANAGTGVFGLVGRMHLMSQVILLVISVMSPLISLIGALGGGAIGLANSLSSLAGVAAALPGIFFAAGAGLSALLVAMLPVAGAFKAFIKLQKDSADNGEASKDSLDKLSMAQETNANSQRDLARATKGVNDARKEALRDLQDLRKEVERANLSEEGARAALMQAEDAYRASLIDANQSDADRAEALYRMHQAEADLSDVRQKNTENAVKLNEAEKKGVEGSDKVVQAKERLRDANTAAHKSTIALRKAQNEARAGSSTLVKDQEALNRALGKLSPSTRAVVQQLLAMAPAFRGLSKATQESLFAPIVDQVQNLRPLLPIITKLLTDAAGAIGRVASNAFKMIGAWARSGDLGLLSRENAFIIETFGNGLLHIANAFRNIAVAAAPFTHLIVRDIGRGAAAFDKFVESARKTGRLAKWLELVYDRTRKWWQILVNVTATLFNFGKASSDFGTSTLDWLVKLTTGWRQFSEGQTKAGSHFKKWLEDIEPLLREAGKFVKALADNIVKIAIDPKNISAAVDILKSLREDVLPGLVNGLNALGQSGLTKEVVKVFADFVDAFGNFLRNGGGGAITTFITTFGMLANLVFGILSWGPIPHILGAVAAAFGVVLATFAVAKLTGFLTFIKGMKWLALNKGNLAGALKYKLSGGVYGTETAALKEQGILGGAAGKLTGSAGALDEAALALQRAAIAQTEAAALGKKVPIAGGNLRGGTSRLAREAENSPITGGNLRGGTSRLATQGASETTTSRKSFWSSLGSLFGRGNKATDDGAKKTRKAAEDAAKINTRAAQRTARILEQQAKQEAALIAGTASKLGGAGALAGSNIIGGSTRASLNTRLAAQSAGSRFGSLVKSTANVFRNAVFGAGNFLKSMALGAVGLFRGALTGIGRGIGAVAGALRTGATAAASALRAGGVAAAGALRGGAAASGLGGAAAGAGAAGAAGAGTGLLAGGAVGIAALASGVVLAAGAITGAAIRITEAVKPTSRERSIPEGALTNALLKTARTGKTSPILSGQYDRSSFEGINLDSARGGRNTGLLGGTREYLLGKGQNLLGMEGAGTISAEKEKIAEVDKALENLVKSGHANEAKEALRKLGFTMADAAERMPRFTKAMDDNAKSVHNAYEEARRNHFKTLDDSLSKLVKSGNLKEANDLIKENGINSEETSQVLPSYTQALAAFNTEISKLPPFLKALAEQSGRGVEGVGQGLYKGLKSAQSVLNDPALKKILDPKTRKIFEVSSIIDTSGLNVLQSNRNLYSWVNGTLKGVDAVKALSENLTDVENNISNIETKLKDKSLTEGQRAQLQDSLKTLKGQRSRIKGVIKKETVAITAEADIQGFDAQIKLLKDAMHNNKVDEPAKKKIQVEIDKIEGQKALALKRLNDIKGKTTVFKSVYQGLSAADKASMQDTSIYQSAMAYIGEMAAKKPPIAQSWPQALAWARSKLGKAANASVGSANALEYKSSQGVSAGITGPLSKVSLSAPKYQQEGRWTMNSGKAQGGWLGDGLTKIGELGPELAIKKGSNVKIVSNKDVTGGNWPGANYSPSFDFGVASMRASAMQVPSAGKMSISNGPSTVHNNTKGDTNVYVNVHNPKPEAASDSLHRQAQKIRFYGGRDE